MQRIYKSILEGSSPEKSILCKELGQIIPLCNDLDNYERFEQWHLGDKTYTHTDMVLKEVDKVCVEFELNRDERLTLYLVGALHNIGQHLDHSSEYSPRVCKCSDELNGKLRSSILVQLLKEPIADEVVIDIGNIIGNLNKPLEMIGKDSKSSEFYLLARKVNVKLLNCFLLADIRAHQDPEMDSLIEDLELYKMRLEELNLWNSGKPYTHWKTLLESKFDPNTANTALLNAIYDFESGIIHSPEEALARSYRFKAGYPELVLIFNVNQSSKDWTSKQLDCWNVISLESVLAEHKGRMNNAKDFGRALQTAKERMKEYLALNEKVIWVSESSSVDLRSGLIRIAMNYGAIVTNMCFLEAKVSRHLNSVSIPSVEEAHQLILCNDEGKEIFRSPHIA